MAKVTAISYALDYAVNHMRDTETQIITDSLSSLKGITNFNEEMASSLILGLEFHGMARLACNGTKITSATLATRLLT